MSTIFLDRDGVINENRSDYVKSWDECRFLQGSKEAIAKLTRAGHRIIVCTNQAAIARGIISVETVEDIHHRMVAEIAEAGGSIDHVYYCPHGKDENCFCRKPRPGLLLRARDELGIDMNDAVFIGDSITDVRAGLAAGVSTVLVLTGLGREQLYEHAHEAPGPFHIMAGLQQAAEMILQGFLPASSHTLAGQVMSCNEQQVHLIDPMLSLLDAGEAAALPNLVVQNRCWPGLNHLVDTSLAE